MYSVMADNIQFKGYTRFLSCNSEGKQRKVSDCPFGTASFGETRGLSDMVKKHSFPNAGVEETVGKLHDNKTYRVYVTDPNEVVDDLIKLKHDYIVYDFEPEYPNIRESFYQENIKKEFEIIKGYLKRLEASQIKTLQSNPKALQINLEDVRRRFAATEECSKIYDEAFDVREQKAEYERKIRIRTNRIAEIEETLPKYEKELAKQRISITNHKTSLPKKEVFLAFLKDKKASLTAQNCEVNEEIGALNQRIQNVEQKIEYIKNQLARRSERVNFLEEYIESAPEKINIYRQEIVNLTKKLIETDTAAEPYIRKICEIYTRNGIRIIKHI